MFHSLTNQAESIIILNPAAKGERAAERQDRLAELLPKAEVITTSGPGDATRITREAVSAGVKRVIAAGGDGTVNEVVNGIDGSGATLGILPIGSVNVFAMELKLPMDLEKAAQLLSGEAESVTKEVDLLQANDRYFVQLAGVGFDAETVRQTDSEMKKIFGPLSYVFSCAQVAGRPHQPLKVTTDEGIEEEGTFLLIGNGRFYGGPFRFFPDAKLDDGTLDVCLFKKLTHFDLLRYFRGALTFGAHTRFPDVHYFKTTSLSVRTSAEVPFEVDGELQGVCPVEFKVNPGALKVVAPV
ncbi:MAG: diacylglycerol kinase family protein [Verrucomicrobiota bacterium]